MGRGMVQEREEKILVRLMELSYLSSTERENKTRVASSVDRGPFI